MRTKPRKSENEMSQATFSMLIAYYTGDMARRNCTPDSIATNRGTLERFVRFFAPSGEELRLSNITPERVDEYVTNLQTRKRKFENHPHRPPEEWGRPPTPWRRVDYF